LYSITTYYYYHTAFFKQLSEQNETDKHNSTTMNYSFEHNNRYTNNAAASINISSTLYNLIDSIEDDGSFLNEVDLHYDNVHTNLPYLPDTNNHDGVGSTTQHHNHDIIGNENENMNDDDNLCYITPNLHPRGQEIIIGGSSLSSRNDIKNGLLLLPSFSNFSATVQHNDNNIIVNSKSSTGSQNENFQISDYSDARQTKVAFTNHTTTHDFYPYEYHAQRTVESTVIRPLKTSSSFVSVSTQNNNGILTDHVKNDGENTDEYRFTQPKIGVAPLFKPAKDTSQPRVVVSSTTTNLNQAQPLNLNNTNEKISPVFGCRFDDVHHKLNGLQQSTTNNEPLLSKLIVNGYGTTNTTIPTNSSNNGNEKIILALHKQQQQQQQQEQNLLINNNQKDSKDNNRTNNSDIGNGNGIGNDKDENETNIKMISGKILAQPRRRSRAIAINKRSRPGDESSHDNSNNNEGSNELYDYATWRMYNRITDHRRKSSLLLSLQASSTAAHRGGVEISSSSSNDSSDHSLLSSTCNKGRAVGGGGGGENRSNSSGLTLSMGTNSHHHHHPSTILQGQQQRHLLHIHQVPLISDYHHTSETAIFDLEL